ncbi:very-short-patch-repair endonuclease [Arthrobacter pascens]|uniref:type IV toxin-antitoxin system AbiEi family antitoxin domain-containing protein n=1 Tax=Arthrobacter pascens TaxID=1677 RepID=UPI002793FC05|nr:type IV toxin-antitoxin system AbiEi family antitoxin domain-containing protein [Arthrobacter pascens]MDQ0677464.1 very-short-patch-repair endonuclease [Arthrobacter pascens]
MNGDKIRALVDARWPAFPVASTRQLTAAGLEERVLTTAVRSGVLLRLRRGAYVRSAFWQGAEPWTRDALQIQAHFESTGGLSRYSHVSAARLHECHVWDVGPRIHVTTDYANSLKSAGNDVRTHRAALASSELTTLWTSDGREILTTSLERTVLDCARILTLEQAAVIGDHALRKGARINSMRQLLVQCPAKRGSRRALDLLDVLDGRSESVGETRTRLLLRSFGLTMFLPQFEIPTPRGLFRADFADPATKIVIEFDGSGKYTDYKPTEEVLLAERRRENAMVEEGWQVLRLEWKHLAQPAELRRRLLAIMDRSKRLSA